MPNYELGKIYKIVDYTNDNIYVGSTAEPTLARRLAGHRSSYKFWLKGSTVKASRLTSFDILKNDNYNIVLLENWPCESKDQLCAREQIWMDQIDCINHANAKGHDTKAYNHQYYKNNSEDLINKSDIWNKNNKDKRVLINKKYNSNEENKKKRSIKDKKIRKYHNSFGGDIRGDNCNLLKIDISLFD